jgi:hypothetical protein
MEARVSHELVSCRPNLRRAEILRFVLCGCCGTREEGS